MPAEQSSILTERFWSIVFIRDTFFKGVWRMTGDQITVQPHVARQLIESGQALNTSDWPSQSTKLPWALQGVQPSSGGGTGAGVSSVNGIEGDLSIVAGPNITVTNLGSTITVGAPNVVPTSRLVSAGAGLSGGGALTGNITLSANVLTVFGRTGSIVAQAGDYNAGQITLSPAVGSWTTVQAAIAGLAAAGVGVASISPGNLSGNVTLAPGANVSITQSGQTITIAATGGGGGTSQWIDIAGGGIYFAGGNVGIGTNTPNAALSVNGLIRVSGSDTLQGVEIGYNTTNNWGGIENFNYTANVFEPIYINGSIVLLNHPAAPGNVSPTPGFVGIGLNSPQYTLDVIGDVNITGTYRINGIPIASGGSVHLMATSISGIDGQPLEVLGDIECDGEIVNLRALMHRIRALEDRY